MNKQNIKQSLTEKLENAKKFLLKESTSLEIQKAIDSAYDLGYSDVESGFKERKLQKPKSNADKVQKAYIAAYKMGYDDKKAKKRSNVPSIGEVMKKIEKLKL